MLRKGSLRVAQNLIWMCSCQDLIAYGQPGLDLVNRLKLLTIQKIVHQLIMLYIGKLCLKVWACETFEEAKALIFAEWEKPSDTRNRLDPSTKEFIEMQHDQTLQDCVVRFKKCNTHQTLRLRSYNIRIHQISRQQIRPDPTGPASTRQAPSPFHSTRQASMRPIPIKSNKRQTDQPNPTRPDLIRPDAHRLYFTHPVQTRFGLQRHEQIKFDFTYFFTKKYNIPN